MDKRVKRFEKRLTAEIYKVLSPPEETTPREMTLGEMTREETTKVLSNPDEATTDPQAFLERYLKAEEAALERWLKVLKERDRRFTENIVREEGGYADVAWDLRKKMIEEAKASLQKPPKRSRTR